MPNDDYEPTRAMVRNFLADTELRAALVAELMETPSAEEIYELGIAIYLTPAPSSRRTSFGHFLRITAETIAMRAR